MITLHNIDSDTLRKLNTLTKYPSIPTYHELGDKGLLQPKTQKFSGTVYATEKVDGTNARVILLPNESYLIGSREDLLHAKGDLIYRNNEGIVDTVKPLMDSFYKIKGKHTGISNDSIVVLFGEVYGGNVNAWKQYTTTKEKAGFRLFDVAIIPYSEYTEALKGSIAQISSWREAVGPLWLSEDSLTCVTKIMGIPRVPPVWEGDAHTLPSTLEDTQTWLHAILPHSLVQLTADAGGIPEGVVIRDSYRVTIAKVRREDYTRSMKKTSGRP